MYKRGIVFDDFHSGTEWQLLLKQNDKGTAEPKTNYVSVEGRDGDLDMTQALTNEVKFNNRTDAYGFDVLEGKRDERQRTIDKVVGYLHGQKRKIILPDYPLHYSIGRIKITTAKNYGAYGEILMEANCEPWMYSIQETVRSIEVSGREVEMPCDNSGVKTVMPEITVTGSITITFGDFQTTLQTGTYKLLELTFKTGIHILKVNGTGTLELRWREAIL